MKRNIGRSLLASILAAGLLSPGAQAEGDRETGKKKFYTCTGCHGIEGYSNTYPTYHVPRIGGQHAPYVIAALKSYQSGDRKHVSMHGNTNDLSDKDLQDIAAYVAAFRSISAGLPVKGDVKAGAAKSSECAGCHGEDGNSEDGNFPRLAGQYESYLVKAMEDYKSKQRKNAIMNGIAEGLSEQEIQDLAAYYASAPQKRGLTVIHDQ